MAETCVYRRKDSPYWWVKYWCPERMRWRAKSTENRCDDSQGYRRALVMARELSAEGRAAKMVAPTARWESWVEDWLRMRHRDSPKTRDAEIFRWRWLDAFLKERKVHGPQGVNYLLGLDYCPARPVRSLRTPMLLRTLAVCLDGPGYRRIGGAGGTLFLDLVLEGVRCLW